MKILLLGASGQVGWELQRSLAPLGELIVTDRHNGGNLEQFETLTRLIEQHAPQVIVNAAAYTAVDKAETEPSCAARINAEAVGVLAAAARSTNALLIHYSTDYVFSGDGEKPWREEDPTEPQGVYGRTKLEGEQRILASGCNYLIFRTSWVYSARGSNFVKAILRLAREREQLSVVADQVGAPTSADLIADITALAIQQIKVLNCAAAPGIYHLAAAGETSWHAYAQFVLETARGLEMDIRTNQENIKPVSTTEYASVAKRPLNSRLCTEKLEQSFNVIMPPWTWHVRRLLITLNEKRMR